MTLAQTLACPRLKRKKWIAEQLSQFNKFLEHGKVSLRENKCVDITEKWVIHCDILRPKFKRSHHKCTVSTSVRKWRENNETVA